MTKDYKKKYSRPTLTQHLIDNEISLVMMTYTDPDNPPPPPPGPSAAKSQSTSPTQLNSFEDNPFGE